MISPQLKNYLHLLLENSTETVTLLLLLRLVEHFLPLQSAVSGSGNALFSFLSRLLPQRVRSFLSFLSRLPVHVLYTNLTTTASLVISCRSGKLRSKH